MTRTLVSALAALFIGGAAAPASAQQSICDQVQAAGSLSGDAQYALGKALVREVADLGAIDSTAADEAALCVTRGPTQVAQGYQSALGAAPGQVTGPDVDKEAQRERVAGIGDPDDGQGGPGPGRPNQGSAQ